MIRKSVFITGASGDIGYAIAKEFADNGYNIIATYYNGNCNKIIEYCNKINIEIKTFKMNLENYQDIESCIKQAFDESDYLDCAVCNAGISNPEILLCDESKENIDKIIDINLKGTIYCNQILSKYFIKQKHGNIINISSIYGLYGGPAETTYSATKAGIIGLTKALALELAACNIRVNAVAPGFIETKMTSCFNKLEKEHIKENTPLQRLGEACDVAHAVFFLASDKASFITGEVLTVSGGVLRF